RTAEKAGCVGRPLDRAGNAPRTGRRQRLMQQVADNNGFSIGDLRISGRVLIAPMTGVSDLPFRRAASKLGAAYVATEMVACEMLAKGRPDVMRRAAVGEGLPLMVVQL